MLARLSILKKLLLPTLAMVLVGAGVIFYSMSSLARMYDMMETSIELRTNRLVYTLEIQEALYSAADKEKEAPAETPADSPKPPDEKKASGTRGMPKKDSSDPEEGGE